MERVASRRKSALSPPFSMNASVSADTAFFLVLSEWNQLIISISPPSFARSTIYVLPFPLSSRNRPWIHLSTIPHLPSQGSESLHLLLLLSKHLFAIQVLGRNRSFVPFLPVPFPSPPTITMLHRRGTTHLRSRSQLHHVRLFNLLRNRCLLVLLVLVIKEG